MIPSQNRFEILVKGATSVLLGVKGLIGTIREAGPVKLIYIYSLSSRLIRNGVQLDSNQKKQIIHLLHFMSRNR